MWSNILLLMLLLICVITDLRERKIYNKVLLPFFLLAILLHLITNGLHGISAATIGFLVGLVILLVPYLMGGMGAGDVKLLAVIGALKGMNFVLMTAMYMAIAGGIMAIFIILLRKGQLERIKHIGYFLICLGQGVKFPFTLDKESLSATYPYGIAIAIGAICEVWFTAGGSSL